MLLTKITLCVSTQKLNQHDRTNHFYQPLFLHLFLLLDELIFFSIPLSVSFCYLCRIPSWSFSSSFSLSLFVSLSPSFSLSLYPSLFFSLYVSLSLFLSVSLFLSLFPYAYPSAAFSLPLSFSLSLSLSVCLSLFFFLSLSVCISLRMHIHLPLLSMEIETVSTKIVYSLQPSSSMHPRSLSP